MLIVPFAIIAFILVGLGLIQAWTLARLRRVEVVAMYLGLERYEELAQQAQARQMIERESWRDEVV